MAELISRMCCSSQTDACAEPHAPEGLRAFAVTSTQIGVHFEAPAVLVSTITGFLIEWHVGSILIGQQTLLPHDSNPLQQVISHITGQSDSRYDIILTAGVNSSTTYDCACTLVNLV
jgi:hypothetical protein